jgi:hypothetical protein
VWGRASFILGEANFIGLGKERDEKRKGRSKEVEAGEKGIKRKNRWL